MIDPANSSERELSIRGYDSIVSTASGSDRIRAQLEWSIPSLLLRVLTPPASGGGAAKHEEAVAGKPEAYRTVLRQSREERRITPALRA